MSIQDRIREEKRLLDEATALGMERAKLSVYAMIQVSANRYAIIERTSRSVSVKDMSNPVGITRYAFVEDCERMKYQDCVTQFESLLATELEVRAERDRLKGK